MIIYFKLRNRIPDFFCRCLSFCTFLIVEMERISARPGNLTVSRVLKKKKKTLAKGFYSFSRKGILIVFNFPADQLLLLFFSSKSAPKRLSSLSLPEGRSNCDFFRKSEFLSESLTFRNQQYYQKK